MFDIVCFKVFYIWIGFFPLFGSIQPQLSYATNVMNLNSENKAEFPNGNKKLVVQSTWNGQEKMDEEVASILARYNLEPNEPIVLVPSGHGRKKLEWKKRPEPFGSVGTVPSTLTLKERNKILGGIYRDIALSRRELLNRRQNSYRVIKHFPDVHPTKERVRDVYFPEDVNDSELGSSPVVTPASVAAGLLGDSVSGTTSVTTPAALPTTLATTTTTHLPSPAALPTTLATITTTPLPSTLPTSTEEPESSGGFFSWPPSWWPFASSSTPEAGVTTTPLPSVPPSSTKLPLKLSPPYQFEFIPVMHPMPTAQTIPTTNSSTSPDPTIKKFQFVPTQLNSTNVGTSAPPVPSSFPPSTSTASTTTTSTGKPPLAPPLEHIRFVPTKSNETENSTTTNDSSKDNLKFITAGADVLPTQSTTPSPDPAYLFPHVLSPNQRLRFVALADALPKGHLQSQVRQPLGTSHSLRQIPLTHTVGENKGKSQNQPQDYYDPLSGQTLPRIADYISWRQPSIPVPRFYRLPPYLPFLRVPNFTLEPSTTTIPPKNTSQEVTPSTSSSEEDFEEASPTATPKKAGKRDLVLPNGLVLPAGFKCPLSSSGN